MHKWHLCEGNDSFRPMFRTPLEFLPICRHWIRNDSIKLLREPNVSSILLILQVKTIRLFLFWNVLWLYGRLCECTPWYQVEDRIEQSSQLLEYRDLLLPHLYTKVLHFSFDQTRRKLLISFVAFAFRGYPWHWYRHNLTNLRRISHCYKKKRRPWFFFLFVFAKMWTTIQTFYLH